MTYILQTVDFELRTWLAKGRFNGRHKGSENTTTENDLSKTAPTAILS